MTSADAGTVLVSSMGMVSSLGPDVISACAAARVGISRVSELPAASLIRQEDGAVEAVRGHCVNESTLGFQGYGRLLALVHAGASDFLAHTTLDPKQIGRMRMYTVLGDRSRCNRGLSLMGDEFVRSMFEARALETEAADRNAAYGSGLGRAVLGLTGWSVPETEQIVMPSEQSGCVDAIAHASEALTAGQVDRALVVAVDSMLDDETLDWLLAMNRLKTGNQPHGLAPGEAAVFVLLERHGEVLGSRNGPLARVEATSFAAEGEPLLAGVSGAGEALASVLTGVSASTRVAANLLQWIVADQNGEPYRASEWGMALARLGQHYPEVFNATVWLPALEFGDTGAASGGVALCVIARAFAGGYAPASAGVVLSSADSGRRAALVVSSPGE